MESRGIRPMGLARASLSFGLPAAAPRGKTARRSVNARAGVTVGMVSCGRTACWCRVCVPFPPTKSGIATSRPHPCARFRLSYVATPMSTRQHQRTGGTAAACAFPAEQVSNMGSTDDPIGRPAGVSEGWRLAPALRDKPGARLALLRPSWERPPLIDQLVCSRPSGATRCRHDV